MSAFPKGSAGGAALRGLLEKRKILRVPGCYDALSVRVIEQAGFEAAFLGGFSVAATRLGLPDLGLLSYAEMLDQARNVCAATRLPVLGDADTGYGNALNVERTFVGFARAGLACVMIEDQRWPKRCGHTAGKEVVDRVEAVRRIRACVRAREEHWLDTLILARTDARATDGLDEALWRARAFADEGADVTFVEAIGSADEMRRYGESVPGWKMANLVEDGRTPWLSPAELEDVGYAIVVYPVSLLLRSLAAMRAATDALAGRSEAATDRVSFGEALAILGWPAFEDELARLEDASPKRSS